MSAKQRVFVIGVGMTKFEKPGRREGWDYPDMAKEAGTKALADAGIDYSLIQQVAVGYVYGDSTCGQRAVYQLGLSGVPIYNVNNNCSTGSTALFLAKQLIEGGVSECVMALGFEKMQRGSLTSHFDDRTNPMDKHLESMMETRGLEPAPIAPQMFGNAGREHMEKYKTNPEVFAMIAEKNHRHSANNPYSQFRDIYSLQDILKSPKVFDPLTKLQCCPTSDGSAAAILCNEAFVKRHRLESQAVEIVGMAMATDQPSAFEGSSINMVGYDMTKNAADSVYRQAGLTAQDAQVIELHDCFSCNELITYEALGLCPTGQAGKLVENGQVTYGGKWVVNPSGGLISKGHPLGATGLAQCSEICWQLRQMCGKRQVPNCKVGLQHNIGLGGAAVVTMYRLGFPEALKPFTGKVNPAIEATPCSVQIEPSPVAAFQTDSIFAELESQIHQNPQLLKSINGIYCFKINAPNGDVKTWYVDVKNAPGSVQPASNDKPDCTVTISDQDFAALLTGKANGQQLFMSGKLKISGNMALAMKLSQLSAPKASL